jgi:hypothetical protein
MGGLAFMLSGRESLLPLPATGASRVSLGLALFAVNVLRNVRVT